MNIDNRSKKGGKENSFEFINLIIIIIIDTTLKMSYPDGGEDNNNSENDQR